MTEASAASPGTTEVVATVAPAEATEVAAEATDEVPEAMAEDVAAKATDEPEAMAEDVAAKALLLQWLIAASATAEDVAAKATEEAAAVPPATAEDDVATEATEEEAAAVPPATAEDVATEATEKRAAAVATARVKSRPAWERWLRADSGGSPGDSGGNLEKEEVAGVATVAPAGSPESKEAETAAAAQQAAREEAAEAARQKAAGQAVVSLSDDEEEVDPRDNLSECSEVSPPIFAWKLAKHMLTDAEGGRLLKKTAEAKATPPVFSKRAKDAEMSLKRSAAEMSTDSASASSTCAASASSTCAASTSATGEAASASKKRSAPVEYYIGDDLNEIKQQDRLVWKCIQYTVRRIKPSNIYVCVWV